LRLSIYLLSIGIWLTGCGCNGPNARPPILRTTLPEGIVAGFRKVQAPTWEGGGWYCAVDAETRWAVSMKNGSVEIAARPVTNDAEEKPDQRFPQTPQVLTIPQIPRSMVKRMVDAMPGLDCAEDECYPLVSPARLVHRDGNAWLIGVDAGEFGGGLWSVHPGGNSLIHLSEQNVLRVFGKGRQAVVVTGLHNGTATDALYPSNAAVFFLERKENWKVESANELYDVPVDADDSYVEWDNGLVLLTSSFVELATKGNWMTAHLLNIQDWWQPRSLAVISGNIFYVGMPYYVVRAEIGTDGSGNTLTWLAPGSPSSDRCVVKPTISR